MRRWLLRLVLGTVLLLPLLLVGVRSAEAHPMGNFSINHYTALTVGPHSVQLLYIVDMAEIPTFQELTALAAGQQGQMPAAMRHRYLAGKVRDLQRHLRLELNGRPLRLQLRADDLLFPPGAGGLSTERFYLVLRAALPQQTGVLSYRDDNFPSRAGWKEIVVQSDGLAVSSRLPSQSASRQLTVYPSTVTSPPPQDVSASIHIRPSAATLVPAAPISATAVIRQAEAPLFGPGGDWSSVAKQLGRKGPAQSTWAAGRSDPLSDLMKGRQLSIGVLLLSLVVAFWFGAGHALSPGHGKTVVGAYLVGSRGTAWHAAILGLTVTATHTAGVFALGLVTLYFSRYILPDQLYPWLGFISGLLVALMGLTLFVRRWRALHTVGATAHDHAEVHGHEHHHHVHAEPHTHEHHHHGHTHEYDNDYGHYVDGVPHRHGMFGRAHTHGPVPGRNGDGVRARDLLALGISGGLLPCPSALVVLLSAIAFHRVAFGLLLIVAFSFGLATTLTSVGLLMVYGGRILSRVQSGSGGGRLLPFAARFVRVAPVLSALVVAGLGSLIAFGALSPGALPAFLTRL